jgi:hypothetical protein
MMVRAGECRGAAGLLRKRLKAISAKGDPLEALNAIVPFESFRAEIEAVVRLAPEERKSNAGRKPFGAVLMFKVLVLQALYNLADEHVIPDPRSPLVHALSGPWPGRYRTRCDYRVAVSRGSGQGRVSQDAVRAL